MKKEKTEKIKTKEKSSAKKKLNEKEENEEIYDKEIKISSFYYINKNKTKLSDLKNGRRIFQNKTEISEYDENNIEFNKNFIEFR